MNTLAVWKVTGATIDRAQRLFVTTFWGVLTLIALALLYATQKERWVAALSYALGLGFWWTFVVGRALLLQRDARVLRVPGIDRAVVLNLGLQYVLSALLPAVLTALMAGKFLTYAGFFSCVVAGALMLQVLPRYLGMLVAILPSGLQLLNARGIVPGWSDPGFVAFVWSLFLSMAAIAAWRWRVVLNSANESYGAWRMPLVIQMYRRTGLDSGLKNWDSNLMLGTSAKARIQAHARLEGIGPQSPVRALRVWLGGAFVPVTWRARLAQVAFLLLPMIVAVGSSLGARRAFAGWAGLTVVLAGTLVPLLIMSVAPARLQRLYADAHGEMSLLALLPGMDNARAKGNLLKAALGLPLICVGIFFGLVLLAAAISGVGSTTMVALTLCTLGVVAFAVLLSLSIAAGKPFPRTLAFPIYVVGLIMLFTTPTLLSLHDHGPVFELVADMLLACWALLYATFACLFLTTARAYRRLPHAFLLHDR